MATIQEIKEMYLSSHSRAQAICGDRYYHNKNDIANRKLYVYTEHGLIEDPYKANNKVGSSFYKLLVDQKVNYLLGQQPTMVLDSKQFYRTMRSAAKLASIKGVQWAQCYISENEMKLALIPTEELLPVFNQDELVAMYRFYEINDEHIVTEYTKDGQRTFRGDETEEAPHMKMYEQAGAEVKETNVNWGVVPFIPLYNNAEGIYDLEPIKAMIDVYDKVLSDFANNLEDFQDIFWILKGYDGQDASKFVEQVRMYKSIPVDIEGDVKAETIQIPHEARMKIIDKLEKLIFKFGFGVDLDSMSGGSLTNVAIKAQFANLDMKCNSFGREVEDFIDRYVFMYNLAIKLVGGQLIEVQEVKFNKSMIVNELEALTANAGQVGMVSEKTRLENHPWVQDVEEEMTLMSEVAKVPDNPIPSPHEGETEQVFMDRCVTFLINEGMENEQAVAICSTKWGEGSGDSQATT